MSIQETIYDDMISARKAGVIGTVNACSFMLGEFGRVNDGKPVNDEDAIKVLKKILKSLDEMLKIKGELEGSDLVVYSYCKTTIPQEASEEQIKEFISTLDFSQFKNKMQAMGTIMKHFGSAADGNLVKKVLMES